MTVEELIEELKRYNPRREVKIKLNNDDDFKDIRDVDEKLENNGYSRPDLVDYVVCIEHF